jgi:hypothetical protein
MNVSLGDLITVMLAVLPLLLLTTSAFFALECLMALGKVQSAANPSTLPADLSLAVLVPAHNEAEGIATTLATILPQLRSSDRLLVIADNCTDATAEAARQAGATVIERHNLTQRGKGYALDFGLSRLRLTRPTLLFLSMPTATCSLTA